MSRSQKSQIPEGKKRGRNMSESTNSVYTREQVEIYLSYISFPVTKYKTITQESARTEDGLTYLAALHKYQLSNVPFENLVLHYSKERLVSIDKDDLFEKIVASRNGRGGYCMENNMFFGTVLKTLGYEVISTGARVLLSGGSGGWSHHVNLVCIASQTYLVDVGFGGKLRRQNCISILISRLGNGPTRPMPLVHEQISKWGATDAETRLIYREAANPVVQGLWYLQHRISEEHDWTTNYCFGLTEFMPGDFEVMNFATSNRKTSWFTYDIVCVKMIRDEQKDDIIGALILSGSILKKRILGRTETLVECRNEDQRVRILKEYFGISLSNRERAGIKSLVTELKETN